MSYIPFNPLVGFPRPHPLFLIVLPLITIAIFVAPQLKCKYYRLACMILLFITSSIYLRCFHVPSKLVSILPCNNGEITFIYDNNQITVIDPGYIGRNKSATSWLIYTLVPNIIKKTGKNSIDNFVVQKPTQTMLQALVDFISEHRVNTIYIPPINKDFNYEIKKLKNQCQKNNCLLVKVNTPLTINSKKTKLMVKPGSRIIKKGRLRYKPLIVNYKQQASDHTILPDKSFHKK